MSIASQLLTQILELAKHKGFKQKELAERAGLSAEALSRAKKAGDMHLSNLQRLANIVGLTLCLGPDEPVMKKINNGSLFK